MAGVSSRTFFDDPQYATFALPGNVYRASVRFVQEQVERTAITLREALANAYTGQVLQLPGQTTRLGPTFNDPGNEGPNYVLLKRFDIRIAFSAVWAQAQNPTRGTAMLNAFVKAFISNKATSSEILRDSDPDNPYERFKNQHIGELTEIANTALRAPLPLTGIPQLPSFLVPNYSPFDITTITDANGAITGYSINSQFSDTHPYGDMVDQPRTSIPEDFPSVSVVGPSNKVASRILTPQDWITVVIGEPGMYSLSGDPIRITPAFNSFLIAADMEMYYSTDYSSLIPYFAL